MKNWPWALGMLILAGVPAIVGGGLVWNFFETWTPVVIWEAILFLLLVMFTIMGSRKGNAHGMQQRP